PADQIGARLDEQPPLSDPAPLQRVGESEAPLRVVPEKIVGDEHVFPDRREILDDGADRPLPEGATVELPHGAEVAAVGTSARRLDAADRLCKYGRGGGSVEA